MTKFVSSFIPETGAREYYFTAEPDEGASFADQLSSVFSLYKTCLDESNIGFESGSYMNIYVSDAGSQEEVVRDSSWVKDLHENGIAVSIIEQPPLFSKVAIFAYHIAGEAKLKKEHLFLKNGGNSTGFLVANHLHTLYFLKGLTCPDSSPVRVQTSKVFDILSSFCKNRGIPYNNILRTWLYLRHIDRDYEDMVGARSRVFSEWGIEENGRFPASTGIGGKNRDPASFILMDAVVIGGVRDEQVHKMEALTHMSPAMDYGVTFERGLRVSYGDREHLYISGTASIDTRGNVMHRTDVIKQTERTLENIRVLLEDASSSMGDLTYLIVYLKNKQDAGLVDNYLKANLRSHVPYLLLQADVCRPDWLIEIEGMAVSGNHNPRFNVF